MKKILTTALLAAIAVSGTTNAQGMNFKSHNSNPWGLVYDGAITENTQRIFTERRTSSRSIPEWMWVESESLASVAVAATL